MLTPLSCAIQLDWDLSKEPVAEDEDDDLLTPEARAKVKCKIFLGFTSNLISSGLRDTLRYLAQHRMVRAFAIAADTLQIAH